MITFIVSLISWSIIPYSKYSTLSEINLGILFF